MFRRARLRVDSTDAVSGTALLLGLDRQAPLPEDRREASEREQFLLATYEAPDHGSSTRLAFRVARRAARRAITADVVQVSRRPQTGSSSLSPRMSIPRLRYPAALAEL